MTERRRALCRITGLGVLLTIVLSYTHGRRLLDDVRPDEKQAVDFFQDWASARFYFDGLPIYGSQQYAQRRYLNEDDPTEFITVNAHPPMSLILFLPFAQLKFPIAALLWNLLSLGLFVWAVRIILRELDLTFPPWAIFYLIPALFVCGPIRHQIGQAQTNVVLLLMIAGTWALARNDRDVAAGAVLGSATAIKLFPGFLFLWFLMQGRWRALFAGGVVFLLWSAGTVGVFGWDNVQDFVEIALPSSKRYYEFPQNQSLLGFWYKLFVGNSPYANAIVSIPPLAKALTALSASIVVVVVGLVAWRARTLQAQDFAFTSAVLGMLLITPLTWPHYYVIFLLPMLLMWRDAKSLGSSRAILVLPLVVLWVDLLSWWNVFLGLTSESLWSFEAQPFHVLGLISLHFYSTVLLFVLAVRMGWRASEASRIGDSF